MKPFLIGLAGLSGAGKSTLADHLETQGGVKRFRLDSYYKDADDCPKLEDGRPHWDLPESLHLDAVLKALEELRNGNEVFVPIYNRRLCAATGETLYTPAPVIFVEGLQLFSDERIRKMFDLRLWLDIDEETALERRLQRQPDYDVEYHRTIALPAQREIVSPLQVHAHETIDGSRTIKEVAGATDSVLRKFLGIE
jgi:uridine kinase